MVQAISPGGLPSAKSQREVRIVKSRSGEEYDLSVAYHSQNERDFLLDFARYGKSIEYTVEIIIVKSSKQRALIHTGTGIPEMSYFGWQVK